MRSSKEFFERLNEDEAFFFFFFAAVQAERDAGAKDYLEAMIPAAARMGYELSEEELTKIMESYQEQLTDEELGKVAGGTSCFMSTVSITIISTTILSSVATTIIGTEGTFDDQGQS